MGRSIRKNFPKENPKPLREKYSLNDKNFKWTFANCLWENKGWKDCRDLRFFSENILGKLQNFESQKWQEIFDSSGGKAEGHGNNNHFIMGDKLPRDERIVFYKINIFFNVKQSSTAGNVCYAYT